MRDKTKQLLQSQSIQKVSLLNSGKKLKGYPKAVRDFFSILPLDDLASTRRRLFGTEPFTKREEIYKEYKSLISRLKTPFGKLVISRNQFAREKGYVNFIDFVKVKDKIPPVEYDNFLKNVDFIIERLNKDLPKLTNLPNYFYDELNQPCLLCLVSINEELTSQDVINYVAKIYPQLAENLPKIQLSYGNKSSMRYLKENDLFNINIRKEVNHRHQLIDLLHELGHVIQHIDCFTRSEDILSLGKYSAEKAATEVALNVLRSYSPKILKAYYVEILFIIHRTLFELEIYGNPNQDYDLLYARLFNKCFPEASQGANDLYLFDEHIVAKPLTSLSTAIAASNLLIYGDLGSN